MLYLVGDSERDLGSGFGSSAKCMPDDVLCRRVASNEGDVAGIREFARHLRRKGLVPNLSEETFVSRLGRKAEREGENVDGVGRSRSDDGDAFSVPHGHVERCAPYAYPFAAVDWFDFPEHVFERTACVRSSCIRDATAT